VGSRRANRQTGPKANHILIRQEVDRLNPPQSSVLPAGEKENDVTKETTAMVNERGPYPKWLCWCPWFAKKPRRRLTRVFAG
jgi:hypothetical protein